MNLVETECTIELQGRKFSANGACVTPDYAAVYVKAAGKDPGTPIVVSSWHGQQLGTGTVVSSWKRWTAYGPCRWLSVRFWIDGVCYAGRFNSDNGQLVRGRRFKGGK